VAAIKNLRSNGVKVVGYTWFPLFTMVDWRYRYGRRPVEHYYIQLGLYKLHSNQNGNSSRWATTPLVEKFQNYMNDPYNSVGEVLEQAQKRAEQYTH
jgi:beta-glucosidase